MAAFLQDPRKVAPIQMDEVPKEWFLEISDLSKPKIKDYMDEEYRKKALRYMVTNMVNEVKKSKQSG
jgi:hypothetical protein